MTLTDVVAVTLSLLVSTVAFTAKHVLTIALFFYNSYPQVSSFVLLILWVYLVYRFTKRMVLWWIHLIVTLVKIFAATMMIVSVGTVYLRGFNRIVYQDLPLVKGYIESVAWHLGVVSNLGSNEGLATNLASYATELGDYFSDNTPASDWSGEVADFFKEYMPSVDKAKAKPKKPVKSESKQKKKQTAKDSGSYLEDYVKNLAKDEDPEIGKFVSNGIEYLKGRGII